MPTYISSKNSDGNLYRIYTFSTIMNIILVAGLTIPSTGTFAQVKCVDSKGRITYSDKPCQTNDSQKVMILGGTGGQSPGNNEIGGSAPPTALENLKNEKRRLEWVVTGAESDMRVYGDSDSARKLATAKNDLLRVDEKILQIIDPVGYQQYLKEKRERERDQEVKDAKLLAIEAARRATAAEKSARAANDRAAAAERAADDANYRAADAIGSAVAAQNSAAAARSAANAAQGAASRPMYCRGSYCYPN